MQYLASDYYATGEGRTICLLITGAYPRQDDYLDDTLKNSEKFRAAREFIEEFDYFAQGAVNFSKEEFMKRFGQFVPDVIQRMLDKPANIHFTQRFHYNYA